MLIKQTPVHAMPLPTNPKGQPCNSRCGTREERRKHAYIWSLCCRCVVGIRGDYKLRSFVRAPNGVTPEVSRFKRRRATCERATRMRGFSAMHDVLRNWCASCVEIAAYFSPHPTYSVEQCSYTHLVMSGHNRTAASASASGAKERREAF